MTIKASWRKFQRDYSKGQVVDGSIAKITDYGLIVDLVPDVFGIVHLNDLDWNDPGETVLDSFRIGELIKTIILSIEPEKERVCLGIRQLRSGPDHDSDNNLPEAPNPVQPSLPQSPNQEAEASKNE